MIGTETEPFQIAALLRLSGDIYFGVSSQLGLMGPFNFPTSLLFAKLGSISHRELIFYGNFVGSFGLSN
jgi:hypothetical protein